MFLGVDIPHSKSKEDISHYTPTPLIGKYAVLEETFKRMNNE